jgi:hypothetical protein
MPDVKEVINGLEMSYKYSNVDENNTLVPQWIVLHAIALLKAQEPRVMTLEEARNVEVVWVEDRSTREIYPCIVKNNMNDSKLYKYGVQWRCWTSRPDEKRRAETPWQISDTV